MHGFLDYKYNLNTHTQVSLKTNDFRSLMDRCACNNIYERHHQDEKPSIQTFPYSLKNIYIYLTYGTRTNACVFICLIMYQTYCMSSRCETFELRWIYVHSICIYNNYLYNCAILCSWMWAFLCSCKKNYEKILRLHILPFKKTIKKPFIFWKNQITFIYLHLYNYWYIDFCYWWNLMPHAHNNVKWNK